MADVTCMKDDAKSIAASVYLMLTHHNTDLCTVNYSSVDGMQCKAVGQS
jgi:hypothetical protein